MGNIYINDMVSIVEAGRWSLEAQVRAYELFEMLSDGASPFTAEQTQEYISVYKANASALESLFDAEQLADEARAVLKVYEDELNEIRFKAAAAASLHEFTKDTYQKWQTAGLFMRKRLLKALRERAGFRLESHRIGNYVAKTFDLMNEAQARFARAQQAVFAADVKYKIRKDTYKEIYNILCKTKN